MQPLSIYIHLPFCKKKCPYCDFNVSTTSNKTLHERYYSSLKKELNHKLRSVKNKHVVSIYFGGGTPSLTPPEIISDIVKTIHQSINIGSTCETTIECNPEQSSINIDALLDAGINRFSVGIQSFDDRELTILGRTHSANEAVSFIEELNKYHVENISIDLMYDCPSQSLHSWQQSLKIATQLPITHISLYNLEFMPKTPFFRRQKELKPQCPSEKTSLSQLKCAQTLLKKHHLHQYEISAFAKKSYESVHNTSYWSGIDYIGVGLGASQFYEGVRSKNITQFNQYISTDFHLQKTSIETLPHTDESKLQLILHLRKLNGFNYDTFKMNWVVSEETHSQLIQLKNSLMLDIQDNVIKLTDKGLYQFDTLASTLV
ncbi:radical SAM family heme chaperone HemW [Chlamydiia bacterium]|nr:radical SAM family heme chaperone HemW [Chlamydiia bacterium]